MGVPRVNNSRKRADEKLPNDRPKSRATPEGRLRRQLGRLATEGYRARKERAKIKKLLGK